MASPGFLTSVHCHDVRPLEGYAAIDKRLGVLWMLCGRMLPSGTAWPGPGHNGPLMVHMGVRSIAGSSSYRRIMHCRVQIAARKLQVAHQRI